MGKTASVRHLAKEQHLDLFEFNFERTTRLKTLFESDLDPSRILKDLSLLSPRPIRTEQALIFFDEVQECPEALKSLRYFFEERPDVRIIAAGSLLEFVLGELSFPVGRISNQFVYPLSFSEFLRATNRERFIPFIPNFSSVLQGEKFSTPPPLIKSDIGKAMREYFIVGGMPEAVKRFVETSDYAVASVVLDDIIQTYKDDTRKYAKGTLQLSNANFILERAFYSVGREVKYTELGNGDEIKRTKLSLNLLSLAQIIHKVSLSKAAGLPLAGTAKDKHFKLVFLDIGLGQRMAGFAPHETQSSQDLTAAYEGKLAEQWVGQQLMAESIQASEDRHLFYWARKEKGSTAEVDYLIVRDGKIYPVEVKNGSRGRLRSLAILMDKLGTEGICLQDRHDIVKNGKIWFLPLYTIL